MLKKLPIILFSNAPKCCLLCYWFLPIIPQGSNTSNSLAHHFHCNLALFNCMTTVPLHSFTAFTILIHIIFVQSACSKPGTACTLNKYYACAATTDVVTGKHNQTWADSVHYCELLWITVEEAGTESTCKNEVLLYLCGLALNFYTAASLPPWKVRHT